MYIGRRLATREANAFCEMERTAIPFGVVERIQRRIRFFTTDRIDNPRDPNVCGAHSSRLRVKHTTPGRRDKNGNPVNPAPIENSRNGRRPLKLTRRRHFDQCLFVIIHDSRFRFRQQRIRCATGAYL